MRKRIGMLMVIVATAAHTGICCDIGYDSTTWQGIALYVTAVFMMIGGMLGTFQENNRKEKRDGV